MALVKLLHLLGLAGFGGGLAAQLVLARAGTQTGGVDIVARLVTGPSLLLLIVSGMLLLALRPGYLEQLWMAGKLILTMALTPLAWFGQGEPAWLLSLGLMSAVAALAVWRPRSRP